MKTKFFTVVAALMICVGVSAQDKINSLTIGFSPIGGTNVKLKQKDYGFNGTLNYRSAWNVNAGYERQFYGIVSLTDLYYGQAKFNQATYKYNGTSEKYTDGDDVYSVGITTYAGKTINARKRFQVPVFIGIGCDYINGGNLHNLILSGAAKARMKFFFSNKFGIYAGGTFKYGFGSKSIKDDNKSISITPATWAVDAGVIIGL